MGTCCKNSARDSRGGRSVLARFRRDEDGGIIIFSLFIFVLMLWFTGMSIDLMRFETTRTKVQGTLDRAVLAAADLDQELPPADVVRDYFEKAGMLDFLDGEPIVDEGINYRVDQRPMPRHESRCCSPTCRGSYIHALRAGQFLQLPDRVRRNRTAEERGCRTWKVSLVRRVLVDAKQNEPLQPTWCRRPRFHRLRYLANNTNAPEGLNHGLAGPLFARGQYRPPKSPRSWT